MGFDSELSRSILRCVAGNIVLSGLSRGYNRKVVFGLLGSQRNCGNGESILFYVRMDKVDESLSRTDAHFAIDVARMRSQRVFGYKQTLGDGRVAVSAAEMQDDFTFARGEIVFIADCLGPRFEEAFNILRRERFAVAASVDCRGGNDRDQVDDEENGSHHVDSRTEDVGAAEPEQEHAAAHHAGDAEQKPRTRFCFSRRRAEFEPGCGEEQHESELSGDADDHENGCRQIASKEVRANDEGKQCKGEDRIKKYGFDSIVRLRAVQSEQKDGGDEEADDFFACEHGGVVQGNADEVGVPREADDECADGGSEKGLPCERSKPPYPPRCGVLCLFLPAC